MSLRKSVADQVCTRRFKIELLQFFKYLKKMALSTDLACSYAALILHDGGKSITMENFQSVLEASNVHVDKIWLNLYVNALSKVDIGDLLNCLSSGVGSASVAAAPTTAEAPKPETSAPAAKKEEKKPESDEEDEDMGFGLFD
ncbi:60S acidic ribosomal protein P1 [Trichinella pseudospiralis]|uniref:Large ribosomal subunit protein P1 n=5 Tax=Trichinella TaxID=6333 RepID=A0A0V1KGG3_TRIPS|nr:60S acidic ribosomal protein P1 [Trichinella pseudospiralis]KRZ46248.1 60S acidic ribosomal protein P1 [Trichinella pseudospiralis]